MIKLLESKTFIIESQYFGSVDWYNVAVNASNIIIEQYDTFQKMTYRNRCIISGSNGVINLTVPLQNGREQRAIMKDVRIDNSQRWQKQHCRALQSSYSKAPFFEYYAAELFEEINRQYQYLFDLNWQLLHWINKKLKLSTQFSCTDHFEKNYDEKGVVDFRNKILPKSRLNRKPAGEQPYPQVFESKFGFIPGLSVLDTLFCKGGL